jgi:hypothetical protein
MVKCGVLFEVRTELLNVIYIRSTLKGLACAVSDQVRLSRLVLLLWPASTAHFLKLSLSTAVPSEHSVFYVSCRITFFPQRFMPHCTLSCHRQSFRKKKIGS